MSANLSETEAIQIRSSGSNSFQSISRATGSSRSWQLSPVKSTTLQRVISPVLMGIWCLWWAVSLYQNDLIGFRYSWVRYPLLGCDFLDGGYGPARVWLQGKDAYAETGRLFCIYPPPVLRMFAWCGLFSPGTAVVVWVGALASIMIMGTYLAWRMRKEFGLCHMTLPTAMALVLFSTPVLFAMERGNCDSLSIVFIVLGISLWRWNSPMAQFMAGMVLALAPWLKVYPGLLGIGCAGLRRWHALAGFIFGGLVIGALHAEEVPKFIRNNRHVSERIHQLLAARRDYPVHAWTHSLTESWPNIWANSPVKFLAGINGFLAGLVILGTLLGWVTYHVYKCPDRARFAFPYLMWIMALATFVPPAANDYSLVFLPIAAVAVWDRKDPLYVQLMMLALLIWWQPLGLPISGRLLLVIKVCGLIAIGISLIRRVKEVSGRDHVPEVARAIAG
jgi:hypothetical protein